jgi:uncharacterized membrane protein YozB (DUF420 family)
MGIQALVGTRAASDINLVVQLLMLAGLYYGLLLARRKQIPQHANVQTAMVVLNLVFIVIVMIPSLRGYGRYISAGGEVSDRVKALLVVHSALGTVVEVYAIYLVARMRTRWIPERFRVRNIKRAMQVTLASWTVVTLFGLWLYAEQYSL